MTTTPFDPLVIKSPYKSQAEGWNWNDDWPKDPPKTPRSSAKHSANPKTPSKALFKTPKTPKKTPGRDRFIPNMNEFDLEMSHYNVMREGDRSPSDYKNTLANTMFEGNNIQGRILKFKEKAPTPKKGSQSSSLHALYTYNNSDKPSVKHRHIPATPERILDAPGYLDDYYLNLLDWGKQHLAIALENSVFLWDSCTSKTAQLCEAIDDQITSIKWLNDSSYLAIGTGNGGVQIWDVTANRRLRVMLGHSGRVGSMASNQQIISSGSRDSKIINHDVRQSAHIVGEFWGHSQEVCGLQWSPDGTHLASGANDNLVNIWDISNASYPRHVLNQHCAAVKALAWCPWESNLLASGGGTADRHIRFWNTTTGACMNAIDTKSQVCSLLWSKHSKEIVSAHGYSQNQLSLWRYPSMVKIGDFTGHSSRVLNMSMSPDGETVCSVAGDETLRFWKLFEAE